MRKKSNSQYPKSNVLELRGSIYLTKIPLLAGYLRLDTVQYLLVIEYQNRMM